MVTRLQKLMQSSNSSTDGGTVIVLEDFGYAGSIGEAYGVRYSGYQLYDTNYVAELDYNYIWMCMQASPCGMNGTTLDPTTIDQHERWSDVTGPTSMQ